MSNRNELVLFADISLILAFVNAIRLFRYELANGPNKTSLAEELWFCLLFGVSIGFWHHYSTQAEVF